jgi:hypothetical protein
MRLENLLAERRKSIVRKWFDQVVNTYPADTSKFLKQQKDPFANPVGAATLESLEGAFDALLKDELDREAAAAALDPVIRIRAVQTILSTENAVGFLFFLKDIVRDELGSRLGKAESGGDLRAFERKIDALGLVGFSVYVQCRETVFQLKANVEKRGVYRAFSRAGLVADPDAEGPAPEDS